MLLQRIASTGLVYDLRYDIDNILTIYIDSCCEELGSFRSRAKQSLDYLEMKEGDVWTRHEDEQGKNVIVQA